MAFFHREMLVHTSLSLSYELRALRSVLSRLRITINGIESDRTGGTSSVGEKKTVTVDVSTS